MTPVRAVRVAVVGCGYVAARCHLPALRRTAGVRLVAVADPDPIRRRLGGPGVRAVADWRDVVRADDVDAVLVAAPSAVHAEIGVAALEAGKHLLLEKPIALTLADADRLCAAERTSGRVAAVGLHLRHARLMRDLQHTLPRIGPLYGGTSAFHTLVRRRRTVTGYERQRASGGGALFDLAYHHFDLYAWLAASPVAAVDCRLESRETEDDVARTIVTLANGARFTGSFASVSYNENRLDLYGAGGRAQADLYRGRGAGVRPAVEGNAARVWREVTGSLGALGIAAHALPAMRLQPWCAQLTAFARAVGGEAAALPGLAAGRAALAAVLAAYQSAASRCEVAV